MNASIVVKNLRKSYGEVTAVDDVSFEVQAGEIFGMVGPNGAGKTTTIECIEGLRQPDEGVIRVLGLDPQGDGYKLRHRIGVQLQESALPVRLRVAEVLDLFASFYTRTVSVPELLERLGLEAKRKAFVGQLSGGQRQRLFIALALLNDPDLIFLDELTTGLDPQARHAMWDLVREMREQGKTIFLTTHFMEEAEYLCDRVAIMDHGQLIALDTPARLIESLNAERRVLFTFDGGFLPPSLQNLPVVTRLERNQEHVVVYGRGEYFVSEVVRVLEREGVRFRNLHTAQPTLEDVFLALTGRELRD